MIPPLTILSLRGIFETSLLSSLGLRISLPTESSIRLEYESFFLEGRETERGGKKGKEEEEEGKENRCRKREEEESIKLDPLSPSRKVREGLA